MSRNKPFELCLVVDDDPDILLSARLLLRDLFVEIATFQAPEEALTAMEQRTPDVVLLAPIGISAVHNTGLFRMQLQPASSHARLKFCSQ